MEDSHNYSFFQEKYDNDNGNQTSTRSSSLHFRQQMAAFIAMTKIYFKENSQGRWMFFGLIVLMLLNSAVRILFSYLARDFWTALGDQDADEFYRILRNYIFALLFLAPVNVFYRFQRQRLAVKWREWMTTRMLQLYYTNRVYYTLERLSSSTSDKNLDNPDQRIAEDVRAFTTFSLSLFLTLAVSLIDLSCFSVILYTIEPPLFLSIIAFAAVGTLATVVIGKQLFRLNFDRLQKEADFRYSLVRIRENAESIAFFRGEKIEGAEVQQRFSRVIGNSYDLIGTQRNLDFFTTLYNYVTWILPVLVIAPQYFQGNVELGVIQQASSAFGHVLDDLSVIINEFESLSEFSASIDRLHQFVQAIRDADPECDETMPLMRMPAAHAEKDGILKISAAEKLKELEALPEISGTGRTSINLSEWSPLSDGRADQVMTSRSLALSIRNLHLTTPDQQERSLIRSLDLDLRWGERLLITGSSGVGKSSLLRAVAGLWTSGSGFIQRAHSSDVYFLPQKPCEYILCYRLLGLPYDDIQKRALSHISNSLNRLSAGFVKGSAIVS